MTATSETETMNVRELKRDFDALRKDVRELKADLHGFLEDTKAVGRQKLETVQDTIGEEVQAARQIGQDTVEMLRQEIEDHPWGTLAAAFCAGIIAGTVFSKRE